jgi:hypothetical protein
MLGPSIFYPVIESRLFDELKTGFAVTEQDYVFFRSSAAYFDKSISRDEIFLLFYFCRVINFIKGLIDKFSLNTGNFPLFIKEKTENLDLTKPVAAPERLGRETLGIILLAKIFREGKIFRGEEKRSAGKFYYEFPAEDFVSRDLVKCLLLKVKIRGLSGAVIDLGRIKDVA